MTRRAPLLVAGDPGLISSGLAPDRHPIMQPLWESCANVRFYQGKVRRLIPAALMFTAESPAAKLRGIHQQQNSDGVRWVFQAIAQAGTMYIQRWYAPAPETIVLLAGVVQDDTAVNKATQVDFQAWGNWTLFNLGYGAIQRFMPGIGVAALPNAPSDVVAIFKKQNQLIAVGTGPNKRGVAWSHADNIELWTAAADNLAGTLTVEELRTPIRGGARLGQHIAAYSEDQMALISYIGQPFVYGQRVALDGIGVVGKKAVCADGRLNYGMSRNGAWQTDGSEFRYIDFGVISDYFQREVNWDQAGKIVVARNDVTRCIEFHFPKGVTLENNEAWSFEPSTGNWAPVTAYQAMDERVLLDKPLVGANGDVFLLDDNPDAVAALSLVTKPMMIDTPEYPGLHVDARVDEIEIAALRASNVQFRLRNAVDTDGPWESTEWQPLSPDMRTYRMPHLPTGTFHKLEFSNTATNWDLDLQGFAFFGFVEGTKRDAI
jgi:hypothetical protein